MATHADILNAIAHCQFGRPLNLKYAGKCALTGTEFQNWDQIRAVDLPDGSTVYVCQQALAAGCFTDSSTEDTHRPFDLEIAKAWLQDPKTIRVVTLNTKCRKENIWTLNSSGLPEHSYSTSSWTQFATRTKAACYMFRVKKCC